MHYLVVRMILIFVIIFILNIVRHVLVQKSLKNRIEMPNKIQRIGLSLLVAITALFTFMAVLGLLMRHAEMATVTSVLTVVMGLLTYFTCRKFKRFYSETDEYFEMKDEFQTYHVRYEEITDWKPLSKQIGILDPTELEDKYICVNRVFSDPEILLRKIAEMTFADKFPLA